MKQNCWEHFKCGREPGGANVAQLGVCRAAILKAVDGIHNGVNGGRCCWAIAGTLCGGEVRDTFASKLAGCFDCEFYRKVHSEEADSIHPTALIEKLEE